MKNWFLRALNAMLTTIGAMVVTFFIGLFILGILIFRNKPTISIQSGNGILHSSKSKGTHDKVVAGVKLDEAISAEYADKVLEKLQEAADDDDYVGILFEVNSPGGSVVPSQEIYDRIDEIKGKKPVVTYVRDMAASGAYYSIASSSKIIACRGSLIGSIGVIMSGMDSSELLKWAKLKPETLKTGKLKDAGSPTRPMNADERNYLQGLLESTRKQFAGDVATARKLPDATMQYMSDGRVILGPEAADLKLVDVIGTQRTALLELQKLAKLEKEPEVYYLEDRKEIRGLLREILTGVEGMAKSLSFVSSLLNRETPR